MLRKIIKIAAISLCATALIIALPFKAQAEPKKLSKSIKVGDTVYFGRYEQDGNDDNGKEKIEWQVLEKKGNKALLISKKVLDVKAYNKEYVDITWENSTIRKWLNKIFINAAFNGKDKNKISITTVENKDNTYGTKGGNSTKDKVFLLSIDEAYKYYKTDKERAANITEYTLGEAKRIGLEKEWFESEQEFNAWWEKHQSIYGWQWWYWLRSPGDDQDIAARVFDDGDVYVNGYLVDFDSNGVRPALWVNL